MKTSDILVEKNFVSKKLLLAAFYQLTYQHDSKDFILFINYLCFNYLLTICVYYLIIFFFFSFSWCLDTSILTPHFASVLGCLMQPLGKSTSRPQGDEAPLPLCLTWASDGQIKLWAAEHSNGVFYTYIFITINLSIYL